MNLESKFIRSYRSYRIVQKVCTIQRNVQPYIYLNLNINYNFIITYLRYNVSKLIKYLIGLIREKLILRNIIMFLRCTVSFYLTFPYTKYQTIFFRHCFYNMKRNLLHVTVNTLSNNSYSIQINQICHKNSIIQA